MSNLLETRDSIDASLIEHLDFKPDDQETPSCDTFLVDCPNEPKWAIIAGIKCGHDGSTAYACDTHLEQFKAWHARAEQSDFLDVVCKFCGASSSGYRVEAL